MVRELVPSTEVLGYFQSSALRTDPSNMVRAVIPFSIFCLPLLFAFQSGGCRSNNANVGPASAKTNRNANVMGTNVNAATGNNDLQKDEPVRKAGQASPRIKTGTWGGSQIGIEVTSDGAEINYPCARGSIKGPLTLDANGNFDLSGMHITEHPGPVRNDETGNSHPARYTGKVTGDQITIRVTLTDTKEDVGTFTLTYGHGSRVPKCA